ncbi:hypothetical protein I6F65_10965 [Pseudoalteromonas sp. SWXJZ94C]|uniref:hypothetical protein n=1 Tax=unclassified Pseudoalteromonas TaxID=194690 RepID=UPI0003FF7E79|nr:MULTISPECIES: hypothetical protein [unclassified Pseudoalteromonas]MBH0057483.1 hypothetical protein [Pseudoalteromonas sp. SWXJZ94C]
MSTLTRLFILLMGISPMVCFSATTAIYKCETSNGVEFSQQPCADNPQLLHLNVQNPNDKKQNDLKPSNTSSINNIDSDIDSYIKITALKKQIIEHQDKIKTYKIEMQKQVSVLNKKSDSQKDNLAGAKRSVAIAEQIMATISRFDVLIKNEQVSIDILNQQLRRLSSTKQNDTYSNENKKIDTFIRKQQIEREVRESNNKIITFSNELKEETLKLESRLSNGTNYEKDAEFDNALSKRMSALNTQYNLLIEVEHKKLNRLNDEISFLP